MENELINKFILGEDYVTQLRMNYPWVERAVSSGLRLGNKSVYTMTTEIDGQHMVIPRVRRKRDKKGNPLNKLELLSPKDAINMALKNKDFIPAPSLKSAEYISKGFSNYQGNKNAKIR
jgi:hypothetical protein|tara:strand:- start:619 stop:975 length:357 start_codon:yes stop_codon:yes gene_type:complete